MFHFSICPACPPPVFSDAEGPVGGSIERPRVGGSCQQRVGSTDYGHDQEENTQAMVA